MEHKEPGRLAPLLAMALFGLMLACVLGLMALGSGLYGSVTRSMTANNAARASLRYLTTSVRAADTASGLRLEDGPEGVMLVLEEPSTGYECKIQTHCVHTCSQDDVVYRFTTLSKDNASLECGNHNLSPDSSRSTQPLEKLMRFDQIRTANGFVIEVEEAQGEQGTFSGSGYTRIPLLANTGVKVKFKNVFINKNYELVSGSIEAEKDKNSL